MKTGNSATAWAAVQSCQEKSKRANAPGDDGGTVLRYQRLHLGIVGDDGLGTALAGLGLGLVAQGGAVLHRPYLHLQPRAGKRLGQGGGQALHGLLLGERAARHLQVPALGILGKQLGL